MMRRARWETRRTASTYVDEITAEHCRADVIMDYGGSILVPTSRVLIERSGAGRARYDAHAMRRGRLAGVDFGAWSVGADAASVHHPRLHRRERLRRQATSSS